MPSGYPNAEQELVRIRNSKDTENQVRAIIDSLQLMGEQIRYQFRHVEDYELKEEFRNTKEAQTVINRALEQQIEQESGVLLQIDPSRGTVFKSGEAETRLNVTVYKRGERITNATRLQLVFGSGAALQWSQQGEYDPEFTDIPSDDSRITNDGFTYVCAASEVSTKVCYKCTLAASRTRAENQVTITKDLDGSGVDAISFYYLLQDENEEAPEKPTTNPPDGVWQLTEPGYTEGSTDNLYTVILTVYSDNSFSYTDVSLSSSYEAAKAAYNKAAEAEQQIATVEANISTIERRFGDLEHVMEYEYLRTGKFDAVLAEEFGLSWDAEENKYYDSVSEQYYLSILAKIVADAYSISEQFTLEQKELLQANIDDLSQTLNATSELINGEIRRGFIDFNGTRYFGIVIASRNVFSASGTTDTPAGEANPYYQIDTGECYGLYTATGWQFWRGSERLAWFDTDDGQLHVNNITIEDDLTMGNWKLVESSTTFGIKYIGG